MITRDHQWGRIDHPSYCRNNIVTVAKMDVKSGVHAWHIMHVMACHGLSCIDNMRKKIRKIANDVQLNDVS